MNRADAGKAAGIGYEELRNMKRRYFFAAPAAGTGRGKPAPSSRP
jgi:hypothetical protein